jgi:hypothetical protein
MQSAGGLGGGAMGECLIAGSDPAFSPGEGGGRFSRSLASPHSSRIRLASQMQEALTAAARTAGAN